MLTTSRRFASVRSAFASMSSRSMRLARETSCRVVSRVVFPISRSHMRTLSSTGTPSTSLISRSAFCVMVSFSGAALTGAGMRGCPL